jgi:hypothetical protein
VLDLQGAVEWVRHERPLLWVGSIFSVPEPSCLPSGYAVSRCLSELLIPPDHHSSDDVWERFLNEFVARWPLELMLDEFSDLFFDLSGPLLGAFRQKNQRVPPNPLHYAVAAYYQAGLSQTPICVTTNWDNLLEKAFREKGYSVRVSGPAEFCLAETDGMGDRAICVLHPHGSFDTGDVVCSYRAEQQQLPIGPEWVSYPTLFMGYSGYEPSLYRFLEVDHPQLWCVRSDDDFRIPAKRRLLCRPNAHVYVGDVRDLLKALGVLHEDVDLTSPSPVLEADIPPKVLSVIRCGIGATLDPAFCVGLLPGVLLPFYEEPECTFRCSRVMGALRKHIRDRKLHSSIPLALMAAAQFRDHEWVWVDLLAYLLRLGMPVPPDVATTAFGRAADAASALAEGLQDARDEDDSATSLVPALVHGRTRCYKWYLGSPERKGDNAREFALTMGFMLGDLGLAGEVAELAGFACARDGDLDGARACLDTAATYYYLTGLWNGGRAMEWASDHLEAVRASAVANTLAIGMDEAD